MNDASSITVLIDFGKSKQTGVSFTLIGGNEVSHRDVAVFDLNVKILPLQQTDTGSKKKDQCGEEGGPFPGASFRWMCGQVLREPLGPPLHPTRGLVGHNDPRVSFSTIRVIWL
jgi:hypothetical protein